MKRQLSQETRISVSYMKELKAILAGLLVAYAFQVLGYLIAWPLKGEEGFTELLIPNVGILLTITPMVTWLWFGLFKVSWIKQWTKISLIGLSSIIPFTIISVAVIFIDMAYLWRTPMFWAVNVATSLIIAVTLFRPFIKAKL